MELYKSDRLESFKRKLRDVPKFLKVGVQAYTKYPEYMVKEDIWPSAEGISAIAGIGEGTVYGYTLALSTGRPEFLLLYFMLPPLRAVQAYRSRLKLKKKSSNKQQ